MGLVAAGIAVGAAALAGTGASIAGQLSKPGQPGYVPPNLQAEQNRAIAGNLGALPQLKQLGTDVDTFNASEMARMLRNSMPYYDEISGKVTKNISSMLSGQIPSDVSAALQRSDAAKAISGGYAGSGQHGNLVARDLGLTSLQLTQQGLSSAESWLNTAARLTLPGQFNIASMFVNPAQQSQVAENNAMNSYNSAVSAWGQPNDLQVAGYGLSQLGGMGLGFLGASGAFNQQSPAPAGMASGFAPTYGQQSLYPVSGNGTNFWNFGYAPH